MQQFLKGAAVTAGFLIFCATVAKLLYWIINEASGGEAAIFAVVSAMIFVFGLMFLAEIEKAKKEKPEEVA